MEVIPYLDFTGRCEEALDFYRQAVGATVIFVMRYKDAPPSPDMCSTRDPNKIMHASFKVGDSTIMASDGRADAPTNFKGIVLSLNLCNVPDSQKFFAALAEGGQVHMPLGKTFFSPSFGMLVDRFGVSWMVHVPSMPEPSHATSQQEAHAHA